MSNSLSTDHSPLTASHQRLACELTGLPPKDLLKVRATNDSLVVVIHTGQKFIYDLSTIQGALERLAAGLGRFTDDYFRVQPDVEPGPAPEAVAPAGNGPAAKPKARAHKSRPK